MDERLNKNQIKSNGHSSNSLKKNSLEKVDNKTHSEV